MTVYQIYDKTKAEYSEQVFENGTIVENFLLTREVYKARWLKFINYNFLEEVSIQNIDLGIGVIFENCRFEKQFIGINIKANGYDEAFNGESNSSIYFKNCTFRKNIILRGGEFEIDRNLAFENCEIIDGISIEEVKITIQSVVFNDCSIKGYLNFKHIEVKQQLLLDSSTIDGEVRIENIHLGTLIFLDSTFNKKIWVWGSFLTDSFVINDGIYEDEIEIKAVKADKSLTIIRGQFKQTVWVDYNDSALYQGFNELYIDACEFQNGIYINGIKNISNYYKIDEIKINISSKLQGDISIRGFDIGQLSFSGYNAKANLLFDDLWINRLIVNNFINNSQLIFSNIKASPSKWRHKQQDSKVERKNLIFLSTSNLGKAQLYQVNLESFESLRIHNVILSDISTSIVRWFDPRKLKLVDEEAYKKAKNQKQSTESSERTLIAHYLSLKEIFRQLKYLSERQGDKPQALIFQRWEMNNYRKYLSLAQKNNWKDRLIMWSSLSNDFGQDWVKPVLLMIPITLVFYIPIGFLSSPNIDFHSFDISCGGVGFVLKELWYQLKIYPLLLNPAHSLDSVGININKTPGIISVFDLLIRIVSSYFIFQIISAFRKYIK